MFFSIDNWMQWFPQPDLLGLGQVILLVAGLVWGFFRFVRGGQAEPLLRGVFVVFMGLVALWGVSRLFHLMVLEFVFLASMFILLIGLIVIFQPELRRTLLVLGQGDLFQSHDSSGNSPSTSPSEFRTPEYLIQELCEAAHFLSKSKRGALLVLESNKNPDHNYLEVGTSLDAQLSTELLLTIFHPNTPLHDGAVIISPNNRIKAAGVLLPLTENPELSWQFGTRHRAAIGLTEISGSRCLVVSEETGSISMVYEGKILKLENAEELKKTLEKIYHVTVKSEAKRISKSDQLGKRLTGLLGIYDLPSKFQKIFKS